MRYILVLAILCFAHLNLPAQKQFHGKIVYEAKNEAMEKETATLVILFGKNAFQLQFKEKRDNDDDNITIVRIDSGKIYNLNRKNKKYTEKKLAQTVDFPTPVNKTIAGYTTTFSEIITRRIEHAFSYSGKKVQITQYFADSLFFDVPSVYKDNEELAFFKDGKIMLGATIKIIGKRYEWQMGTENFKPDSIFTEISLEAIEVNPMQISDGEFTIPADYAINNEADMAVMDSMRIVDSVVKAETEIMKAPTAPAKKKAVRKPVAPNKKTTKSPARKPE